jgi:ABC-2 type transport system ATP-binding protein
MLEDVIILEEGRIIRNENTEELLSRHRLVSGKDTEIDEFCKKYKVLNTESLGRSKTVCVEIGSLAEFEKDIQNYDFDVSQASLQKLFTQLLN